MRMKEFSYMIAVISTEKMAEEGPFKFQSG